MRKEEKEASCSMVEKKDEHVYLFETASADIKLVEKNMHDKDIIPQILLFHLQQGIEKLLKSLISSAGNRFPRVHDILNPGILPIHQ